MPAVGALVLTAGGEGPRSGGVKPQHGPKSVHKEKRMRTFMGRYVGAEVHFYQDLEHLLRWRRNENPPDDEFETAARSVATDWGVPHTDIWDYLADLDEVIA